MEFKLEHYANILFLIALTNLLMN